MRTQLIPMTTPVSTGRAAAARGLARVAHREMNYAAGRVAEPRVTGR